MGLLWKLSLDLHDALRFGGRRWFWKLHLGLWREYQRHSLLHQEGSLTYGETATSTVVEVLSNLGLQPGQRILDLGSGRGLPVLVAASLGFESFGLEFFPEHVARSQRVADRLRLNAHFRAGDFLSLPWPEVDAYFTCSTAFQPDLRVNLRARLSDAPAGTWIVTQDWDLTGPDPEHSPFELVRSQKLPVTWGTAVFRYYRCRGEWRPLDGRRAEILR
jgi:SAM-dependent methyltransferase